MPRPSARRWTGLMIAAAFVATPLAASATPPADMRSHAKSLEVVPADAAFYLAWLKNREQIDLMLQTNAWRRLTTIPMLQLGWSQVETQWRFPSDPTVQLVKDWVESGEGQEFLALLSEMTSDEVFVYGEASCTRFVQVAVEISSAVNQARYRALGDALSGDGEEEIGEQMTDSLRGLVDDYGEQLVAPGLVMGFRVQDAERGSRLLDRAEQELRKLAEQCPVPIGDDLRRSRVEGRDLLSLTLSTKMLPWEDIQVEMADSPEAYEMLRELADGKQVVLSIGVVRGFVVFTMGDRADVFAPPVATGLGAGASATPLMVDQPAFRRLDKHAGERVTSLAYAGAEFQRAANSNEQTFRDLADMGKGLLPLAELPDGLEAVIKRDIDELAADLTALLPDPGATAAIGFMTERGYETFAYTQAAAGGVVPSRPLTLIDHLGADSLAWVVARGKRSVGGYDRAVGWMRRIVGHAEAIARETAPEDWTEYEAARRMAAPLLKRLDDATRDCLIPGLADGQSALVLNTSAADAEWCEFMPPSDTELPLPAPVILWGVSDAALVERGAREYFDVTQQAIDAAHQAAPDAVPAFSIPAPIESTIEGGVMYGYQLPAEWGASGRIMPHACLGESVLLVGVLPELSERLLPGNRPGVEGPAAEFDRPLASAGYVDLAGCIDALRPWIDYGIQFGVENAGDEGAQIIAMAGFVKPQVDQLLTVLQVVDSMTSVTYHEDDMRVSHSELRIVDLSN